MSDPLSEAERPGFIQCLRNGFVRPSLYSVIFVFSLLVFVLSLLGGLAFYVNSNTALPRLSLNVLATGDEYYLDGQYNNALREYQRAVDVAPADSQSLISLGTVYYAMGDSEAAMQTVQQALRFKPREPNASYFIGLLYLERGQAKEAIPYISRFTQNRSGVDAAQAYNDLGVAYSRSGDLAQAAENYRQALLLNPRLSAAQKNLDALQQRNP
jgi:tetratricopeptide (TPR) repeat protein